MFRSGQTFQQLQGAAIRAVSSSGELKDCQRQMEPGKDSFFRDDFSTQFNSNTCKLQTHVQGQSFHHSEEEQFTSVGSREE